MSDFFDLWQDVRLDSTHQLGFTIAANNPKADYIVEDAIIEWDGQRFYVVDTETIRDGARLTLDVRCNALWNQLADQKRPGTTVVEQKSARDGLDQILTGSGWVSTSSTSATALKSFEKDDGTVLSLVREWADVCNGFVVFDTWAKTVDVVPERGRDLGAAFRYRRNLTNIKRRATAPKVTRVYPYGSDGLTIAGVNGGKQYLEDFSYYTDQGIPLATAQANYTKGEIISDPKFVEEADLLAWGRTRLAELAQPEVSYECKVIDLRDMDPRASEWRLQVGDRARVVDEPLGFNVLTTVVRLKEYPKEPWKNEVELAYLYSPDKPSSSSNTRGNYGDNWVLFKHDNLQTATRMDGSTILNRIGLRFREGGEAVYGYDINFVGVGTGTMGVTAFDAETMELLHPIMSLPYTDGEIVHENMTWALQDLVGTQDVRIRAQAVSTSGPAISGGADYPAAHSRLWILAKGAVRESPTDPNTEIFDFNGANTDGSDGTVQYFTVPDDVFEVEVSVMGAAGGQLSTGALSAPLTAGGAGTRVIGKMAVVPGEIIDVYVGGSPGSVGLTSGTGNQPGWPNGGYGGPFRSGSTVTGQGGGGSSHIVRSGGSLADALIVAPAGGGEAENGQGARDSSFLGDGSDAPTDDTVGQSAPNQYQGGAGGVRASDPSGAGYPGTFGQGGNAAAWDTGTSIFSYYGGGGGGGWYGGGGGCDPAGGGSGLGQAGGSGGGGCGWVDFEQVYDVSWQDAANTSDNPVSTGASGSGILKPHGQVVFTWQTPEYA